MQFIDLNRQYKRIKKDVDQRIQSVLNNNNYIMGTEVIELEKKLPLLREENIAFPVPAVRMPL